MEDAEAAVVEAAQALEAAPALEAAQAMDYGFGCAGGCCISWGGCRYC